MMHHHPTSSGLTSAPVLSVSSSTQRDRERQREQRRQQAVLVGGGSSQPPNNNPQTHVPADKSIVAESADLLQDIPEPLFPVEPVMRVQQEDNFSKEIKSTLGEFGKLKPFLTNSSYPTDGTCNLVGISRNEINRLRVNEIVAEMTQHLPPAPITGLDDIPVEAAEMNHRSAHYATVPYHHHKNPTTSSSLTPATANTHSKPSSSPYGQQQQHQHSQSKMSQAKPTLAPSVLEPPKSSSLRLSSSSSSASGSGSSSSSSASESSESEDEADSSGSVSSKNSDHQHHRHRKDDGEHNSDDNVSSDKLKRNGTSRAKCGYKKSAEPMEVDARVKLKNQENHHRHDEDDETSKWDLESFIKDHQPKNSTSTTTIKNDFVARESTPAKYGVPSDSKKHSGSTKPQLAVMANHKSAPSKVMKPSKSIQPVATANRAKMDKKNTQARKRHDSSEPSEASYASDASSTKSSRSGSRPPSRTLSSATNHHQDHDMEEGELNDQSHLLLDTAMGYRPGRTKQPAATAQLKANDISILDQQRGPKQSSESKSMKKNQAAAVAPPVKFTDMDQVSLSNKIPKVPHRTHDENSWKDVKRRKEPPSGFSTSAKHSSSKADAGQSMAPTALINSLQGSEPTKLEPKNRNQSSGSKPKNPSPTPPVPSNRKAAKYSPHSTKAKEPPPPLAMADSNFSRKVEFAPSTADPQQQSLIVSIELPKLNRVPDVERNGFVHAGKKPKESKKSEPKYLNGKPAPAATSLSSKTPKGGSKTEHQVSGNNKFGIKAEPSPAAVAADEHRSHRHQSPSALPVSIPISNQIKLKTSPMVQSNAAGPAAPGPIQHRSPLCHNEQEAQSMARTLKRKADSIKSLPHQILQYIEASLYFIQAGLFMEQKQEKDMAFKLYRDTLAFVKQTTSKLSKNRPLPAVAGTNEHNPTDLKLLILSYRVQALLNSRLTKIRAREIHENKTVLEPLLAEQLRVAADTAATTITLPVATVSMVQRQLMLLMHPFLANDLWIKAETMLENNAAAVKSFFQQIDQECGPLQFSSLMEHFIHHTLKGVKLLQESLPPYDLTTVAATAAGSSQAVPPPPLARQ